jgi:hypothetical protein
VELVRLLVRRGTDFDVVVELVCVALALGDEFGLWLELVGWFAGMGEFLEVVVVLVDVVVVVELCVRVRSLVCRALLVVCDGCAVEVVVLFEQVVVVDEGDPIVCEMLGLLLGWVSEVVMC